MQKQDTQYHSSENPYSSWHTSQKQKDLGNDNDPYTQYRVVSKVDNNQDSLPNQDNRKRRNRGRRGGRRRTRNVQKDPVNYIYVPKYLVQQTSQQGNQQDFKKVNAAQSSQASTQASSRNNNQYIPKSQWQHNVQSNLDTSHSHKQSIQNQNYEQAPVQHNKQNQQQNKKYISKNEFNNNQKEIQKEILNHRELQEIRQDFQDQWKANPKKNQAESFYQKEDQCYNQPRDIYSGQKGDILKVLMIAEKPQIARKIASALSERKSRRRNGLVKFLPIYEYKGRFNGQKALFKVTSVVGHVYNVDFPRRYKDWNRIKPVKLFSAKTEKKEVNPKNKIVKHLENEARDCSYLLLWLDNDKEGENICFEVQQICQKVMCYEGQNTQQILRSKFSSLTDKDLIEAYENISETPNMNQSKAVDARRIIDLKIGVAFTRYLTLFFRNKYPHLHKRTISFGPCQTPTLGFCVEREDEINNFKPKLEYIIELTFMDGKSQTEIISYCDSLQIQTKIEAQRICKIIELEEYVTVTSVKTKRKIKPRPVGLNTVEMLKVGSSLLKMSPAETSNAADNLYAQGLITYPRTESTAYCESFEFDRVLESLCVDKDFGTFADELLNAETLNLPEGEDLGDHPPITPTGIYPRPQNKLSRKEQSLYHYISRHFIASLSEDCEYEEIEVECEVQCEVKNEDESEVESEVEFEVTEYKFVTKGIQIIDAGFTNVIKEEQFEQYLKVKNIQKGKKLPIQSLEVFEEYSTPPHYLSETELISLMEEHQIGTDASIPTHIQNIVDRKYVEIDIRNRTLKPTQLGRSLIDGYKKIDEELVQPEIRAYIEESVEQIALGKKQFSDVLNESLDLFQKKYINFVQNIHHMDNLIGLFCKSFKQLLQIAKPFSKCGVCNNYMKIIEEAEKLVCETCNIKLAIPMNGKLKLVDNEICSRDKYQILSFKSEADSFKFCPKCYSDQYYNKGRR